MIEEVQIKKAYQKTFIFYRLCKCLYSNLPLDIEYVEAFADERNLYSRRLMNKLGMKQIVDDKYSHLIHLRGCAKPIKKYFR